MWWLVGVVVLVAVMGTYVTWIASRVERLHSRAVDAEAALIGKLNLRAKAALLLADAGSERLGRYADALRVAGHASLDSLADERESAENDLTRVLRELPLSTQDSVMAEIRRANRRVAVAKQVHTDVVRDAQAVRSGPVVRVFRLTRHLPRPRYFNIDDPTLEAVFGPRPSRAVVQVRGCQGGGRPSYRCCTWAGLFENRVDNADRRTPGRRAAGQQVQRQLLRGGRNLSLASLDAY